MNKIEDLNQKCIETISKINLSKGGQFSGDWQISHNTFLGKLIMRVGVFLKLNISTTQV